MSNGACHVPRSRIGAAGQCRRELEREDGRFGSALTTISAIEHTAWQTGGAGSVRSSTAGELLESGSVLFFPRLPFAIEECECELFSPGILSSAKNASFDPVTGRAGGTALEGRNLHRLRELMARFSECAAALAKAILPLYQSHLTRARASFRPAEI